MLFASVANLSPNGRTPSTLGRAPDSWTLSPGRPSGNRSPFVVIGSSTVVMGSFTVLSLWLGPAHGRAGWDVAQLVEMVEAVQAHPELRVAHLDRCRLSAPTARPGRDRAAGPQEAHDTHHIRRGRSSRHRRSGRLCSSHQIS